MVAGMERYYQIARCYRDEDFRADRQPEFTQLDIEMSFVEQDDVIAVAEEVLAAVWALVGHDVPTPLPRMTYAEAMARFGTDKPDLRMGLELVECTDYFKDTPFRVFQAPYVGAVVMPGGAEPAAQAARRLAGVGQAARRPGARLRAGPGGRRARRTGGQEPLRGGAGRARRPRRRPARATASSSRAGLPKPQPRAARRRPARDRPPRRPDRRGRLELRLGRRRAAVRAGRRGDRRRRRRGRRRRVDRRPPRLHLAAGPRHLRHATPASALAWAYDIVCNGNEIGGGSIRIHREDVQKRVFAVMGIGEAEAQEKFGFLLDAFRYGAPPHGGIAFGWDRIAALLRRHRLDPRGHRVPEVRRRGRPADRTPLRRSRPQQRKEAGVDADSDGGCLAERLIGGRILAGSASVPRPDRYRSASHD